MRDTTAGLATMAPDDTNRGTGSTAMIMAAGFGSRMRDLTRDRPKPLVEFNGKALIDHALDRLRAAGVQRVVVNVHYMADQIEAHLNAAGDLDLVVSDERAQLLDTGGGLRRALPHLGPEAFFVMNTDSVWAGGAGSNLDRLIGTWDDQRMDCLLLLAPCVDALGYEGQGDFAMDVHGALRRKRDGEIVPFVNTGVYLLHPRLFEDTPETPFSVNLLWDRAIEAGRLFGCRIDGSWMHIGSPEALEAAETKARALTVD